MDTKEIKQKVYRHFESGLHCAEAVSSAVLEVYRGEARMDLVKAASGFGGGIGGSTAELCGAFTGGIIALGVLLGRDTPGDNLKDCGTLSNAFKTRFQETFNSMNCGEILTGFSAGEDNLGCVKLTAEAAVMLVDLLTAHEREKGLDLRLFGAQPRAKIPLGCCPFTSEQCVD